MLPIEEMTSTNLKVLWDFEGVMRWPLPLNTIIPRYSPLFYGFYANQPNSRSGYKAPFAYFLTMMAVYAFRCHSLDPRPNFYIRTKL